ncbi:helix-turn-helix domain-containing protein [Luteimonas salinilitoris]|uniref:Helix-turn-helix domain-containing protein n=1 Tax=Luteimonas salinilitoris TaxID=3237697 RepID=A0ABV4HQY7_9GAMM
MFAARLRQARALRGIDSQRALGLRLGLDKKLASSRINRYETEARGIDLDGLARLAGALNVPVAYLVAEDEHTANVLLAFSGLPEARRAEVAAMLQELVTCG